MQHARRQYGADPVPVGAWSSHMGAEDGAPYQGGAASTAFAYQHPEGHWEVVHADVAGMPDINGTIQPQAVMIPCPGCGESMRLTQDSKPFRVGGRRVIRLPGENGLQAHVVNAPLTVDDRLVCGNRGQPAGNPNVVVECDFDAIVYNGMAYPPAIAVHVMHKRMGEVEAKAAIIGRRVAKMGSIGFDAASCARWADAARQVRDAAGAAFARAQAGTYERGGPESFGGVWQTIDESAAAYDRMDKSLKEMGL